MAEESAVERASGLGGSGPEEHVDAWALAKPLTMALAVVGTQAGFHSFVATVPLALAAAGYPNGDIGIIVGAAAVVQIPAAFAAGPAIDHWGAKAVFTAGSLAYLAGAILLVAFDISPGTPLLPILAARVMQGIGAGTVLPSALAIVPQISLSRRIGIGLGIVGSANNVALVSIPALSVVLLSASSLHTVAVCSAFLVISGAALCIAIPTRRLVHRGTISPLKRPFRYFSYHASWTLPLLVVLLINIYWGTAVAFLPQRATAVGVNIGPFFAFDGVGVLLFRIPAGWLADHVRQRFLMLVGVCATLIGLLLLFPVPGPLTLALSGLAGGIGSGLVMTPIFLELARRSASDERGSAFSLLWAAFGGATAIGSMLGAPIITWGGFDAALALGVAGVVAAGAIVVRDPLLS